MMRKYASMLLVLTTALAISSCSESRIYPNTNTTAQPSGDYVQKTRDNSGDQEQYLRNILHDFKKDYRNADVPAFTENDKQKQRELFVRIINESVGKKPMTIDEFRKVEDTMYSDGIKDVKGGSSPIMAMSVILIPHCDRMNYDRVVGVLNTLPMQDKKYLEDVTKNMKELAQYSSDVFSFGNNFLLFLSSYGMKASSSGNYAVKDGVFDDPNPLIKFDEKNKKLAIIDHDNKVKMGINGLPLKNNDNTSSTDTNLRNGSVTKEGAIRAVQRDGFWYISSKDIVVNRAGDIGLLSSLITPYIGNQ